MPNTYSKRVRLPLPDENSLNGVRPVNGVRLPNASRICATKQRAAGAKTRYQSAA
jgi:hypothetical protein